MHPRARDLFHAYLNCYSFPTTVLERALPRLRNIDRAGEFPWPEHELERLWNIPPRTLRIGVPQGGAVSGVIANLVLFFIAAVAIKTRAGGLNDAQIDWVALSLVVFAAVALWRLKWSVINVIAACALAGLVLRALAWV